MKKSDNYYVDNNELLQHMKEYKERKKKDPNAGIDDYTARCILKIVRKFASRKNFSGYTYKDDMISGAVENILLYIDNFDPEISKNPFAYFTQIAYFSFLRKIREEKKHTYIRFKSMQKYFLEDNLDSITDVDHASEGHDFSLTSPLYDNMQDFIDEFEGSMEELKNKNKQYNINKEREDRKTNRIQSRYSPLEFEDE